MFRAVLWKELREQAAILIALLALSGGVIAAAVQFGSTVSDLGPFEFRAYLEPPRLAALLLAVTAGVVVGGALFAGEKETGTFGVLEMLPTSRARVWRGKMVAGAALAVAAGAVLMAEAAALGAFGRQFLAGWVVWGLVLTLAAFAWGALGSTLTETTLAACGGGLVLSTFTGVLVLMLVAAVLGVLENNRFTPGRPGGGVIVQATAYLLVLIPVGLSGLVFTAPDRARRSLEVAPGVVGEAKKAARRVTARRGGFGFVALLWLVFRQSRVHFLIGSALAALAGLAMLHDQVQMLLGWPAVTLFAGVLAGVLGWADEQRGAYRFWGERRLPAGRLWAAKVAAGLGLALFWSLLVLLPSFARQLGTDSRQVPALVGAFRSGLLADAGYHFLYYLFVWPVYGFAFGHLAGLLFQKTVVAAGVGVLTAGPAAGLWLSSVFAGGLRPWQVVWLPVLVLVAARLIVWAWAADGIGTRRPITRLAAAGLLAVGFLGCAVAYRVLEVPIIPEADDDLTFAAAVPSLDSEDGGRELRRAAGLFRQGDRAGRESEFVPTAGYSYGIPNRPPLRPGEPVPVRVQVERALKDGWPADRPDLAEWLDQQLAGGWDAAVFDAAAKPLGPIENPLTLNVTTPLRDAAVLRDMAVLMLVRGLKRQADGDPAAFVPALDAVLAASRNARRQQPAACYVIGLDTERLAFQAVERWLERLAGRPDLLRAALAVLAKHDATCPRDPAEPFLTGRMILRNTVNGPSAWAPKELEQRLAGTGLVSGAEAARQRADVEANLLAFSWVVPWERERLRRAVGLGNDPSYAEEVRRLTSGAFLIQHSWWYAGLDLRRPIEAGTAYTRLSLLTVALRLYQAETGAVAPDLDALVPAYLPAVPTDPFDRKPFKYRVSAGEQLEWERVEPPPPAAPTPQYAEEELDAAAAVAGGLVQWSRPQPPPPVPPGLTEGGMPDVDFEPVAAVASGLVCWPLPPLDEAAGPIGLPGVAFGPPADERRKRDVAAGQGIVWSVGPDGMDGGGVRLAVQVYAGWGGWLPGDLIAVVPPPAVK